MAEVAEAEYDTPRPDVPGFDADGAAPEVISWLVAAQRTGKADVNALLTKIAQHVRQTPFNLMDGQWFLGTESLPNQAELDKAKGDVAYMQRVVEQLDQDKTVLEEASAERHHVVMELVDVRNNLQAKIAKVEALCEASELVYRKPLREGGGDVKHVLVDDVLSALGRPPLEIDWRQRALAAEAELGRTQAELREAKLASGTYASGEYL